MSADAPTASVVPIEYASFARRLGAALFDSLVWLIGILFFFPGGLVARNPIAATISLVVIASAWFNYFAICEWRFGQTIGKNATGIRVLALEGGGLSYNAAALRNLARLIDLPLTLVGVEYWLVRRSPRHQRLGDRFARTIVARERPKLAHPRTAGAGGPPAPPFAPPQPPPAPPPPRSSLVRSAEGFPFATWGPALALGGIALALIGSVILSVPLVIADPKLGTSHGSLAANLAAQLVLTLALIGASLFVAMQADGKVSLGAVLGRLGVRRFDGSAFGWMALAAFSYLVAAGLLALLIKAKQKNIAVNFGPIGVQIVLIALLAPMAEELSFRGMLFGGLRRRLPTAAAAVLSGLVFGLAHATTGISVVPQLAVFGTVLALLYERTGSIVPGMMLHALNNTVALVLRH